MKEMLTLRLTIDVTYRPHGEPLGVLRRQLFQVAQRAADNGMLSGVTSAEVDGWTCDVKEIEKK